MEVSFMSPFNQSGSYRNFSHMNDMNDGPDRDLTPDLLLRNLEDEIIKKCMNCRHTFKLFSEQCIVAVLLNLFLEAINPYH